VHADLGGYCFGEEEDLVVVLVRIYGIVGSSFGGIIVPCERREEEEEERLYIATERMLEKFRN
jgi:hypothetical protein